MARSRTLPDPSDLVPLKPLVFEILVSLGNDERHGWDLVREVQRNEAFSRIMPGNFYRSLRTMLADGLIAESRPRTDEADPRRRYFRVTPFGESVAAAEAERLAALVVRSRARRLLARR